MAPSLACEKNGLFVLICLHSVCKDIPMAHS